MIDVRVKDRRKHIAARQLVGIISAENDLRTMNYAFFDLSLILDQTTNAILDNVSLRRIPERFRYAYVAVASKQLSDPFIFGLQSAKSDAHD